MNEPKRDRGVPISDEELVELIRRFNELGTGDGECRESPPPPLSDDQFRRILEKALRRIREEG